MSDFKDKLKMFEASNPPPLKAKPSRQTSDSPGKVPEAKVPRTEHLDSASPASTSEEVPVTPSKHNDDIERLKEISPGEDFCDFETFYFCNSVYDLPGLELFVLEPVATETVRERTNSIAQPQSPDEGTNQPDSDVDRLHPTEDIQLSPSPALIEEIFNTGIWRNSNNFSDDFIFAPPKISVPTNPSEDLPQSATLPTAVSDQKKAQPQGRRSIFDSIFRSKRKPKKSTEKLSGKDNSDSDSLQDSPIKGKQSVKSLPETDSGSLDAGPVKPLNSMFNRDWLNTIGDGIKKKASVMSELKKVFTHGKFKHFKKKNPKNGSVASSEKTNVPTKVANLDDSIYDSDVEVEQVHQPPSDSLHGQGKKPSKKSASSNYPKGTPAPAPKEGLKRPMDLPTLQKETLPQKVKKEDVDSIYDEDSEEETASNDSKGASGVVIKPTPSRMPEHAFGSHVDEIYVQDEDNSDPLTTPGPQAGGPPARPTSGTDSIYDDGSDDDEAVVVKKAPPKEPSGKSMSKTWGNIFRGGISKEALHDQIGVLKTNQSVKDSRKVNFPKRISPKKNEKENDTYDDEEEVIEEYADDVQEDVSAVVIMAATKVPNSVGLSKAASQGGRPSGKGGLLPSVVSSGCMKEFLENDEYDADADDMEVYACDDEGEEVGRDDLSEVTKESKEERTMEMHSDNEEEIEEYFSDVDDDVEVKEETATASQEGKKANVATWTNSRETEQYDQDYDDDGPDVPKVAKDLPLLKAPGSAKTASQKKPVFKDKSKKNKPFFRIGKKDSELYDDDIDEEDIEEYVSDGSLDVPEVDIPKVVDKGACDPKVEGGKVSKTKDGKKLFNSKFFMGKKTEKEVGPFGMAVHRTKKELSTEVYDDDYDDSLMSEEVLTVARKGKDKVEDIERRAAETRVTKERKQRENIAVDRKKPLKVEMSGNPPRKTPSSQDEEEAPMKRDARVAIRSDEYDDDEEESFNLSKSIEEVSVEVFSFNTEDDALKKVIKKNLNTAKKTFKLKEPIRPIATARAIKTVYSEGKLHMKFNVGEILEVLEYRDDLILVRNGVGKCGLTAKSNIQMLKRNA